MSKESKICKYCGVTFEGNVRREYCFKEECIRKNRNETQQRYLLKKKNAQKQDVIENQIEIVEKEEVFTKEERSYELYAEDISELQEIGRELGAIKFKISESLKKIAVVQSNYDKEDQNYLHLIENIDTLTKDKAFEIVKEQIVKRNKRRCYKNKTAILMKTWIPPNPAKWVIDEINRTKKQKYFPRKVDTNDR